MKGRFDALLHPVNEKTVILSMLTVLLPILRELVAAVTVIKSNGNQFSVLIFMYSTVLYLAFMLGGRRFK
jgi:hypothetical protein